MNEQNNAINEADTDLERVMTLCSLGCRLCHDIWCGGNLSTVDDQMIWELDALLASMRNIVKTSRKPLEPFYQ